jgi:antitoxin component YwqK of YwqJK toxin-antitoxin module
MTNAEILNNTVATTSTSLADMIADAAAAQYEEVNSARDLIREMKAEAFKENTAVYAVVTNATGYYGYIGTTPQGDERINNILQAITKNAENKFDILPAQESKLKDGTKLSTQQACLKGVAEAINDSMKAFPDRKKITVYLQDSEVLRLSGFVKKAKENATTPLTEGQVNFIAKTRGYGQIYANIAARTYQMVLLALKSGYTLQFNSLANIGDIDTVRVIDSKTMNLPMTASFRSGVAIVGGKQIAAKEKINGSYELVDANGKIAIKRKLSEEQELAKSLKMLVDSSLKMLYAHNQEESFTASDDSAEVA